MDDHHLADAGAASTAASSSAESPPPTTHTSLPTKNGASHEAQCETPLPRNSASPGMPSERKRRARGDDHAARGELGTVAVQDSPVAVDLRGPSPCP